MRDECLVEGLLGTSQNIHLGICHLEGSLIDEGRTTVLDEPRVERQPNDAVQDPRRLLEDRRPLLQGENDLTFALQPERQDYALVLVNLAPVVVRLRLGERQADDTGDDQSFGLDAGRGDVVSQHIHGRLLEKSGKMPAVERCAAELQVAMRELADHDIVCRRREPCMMTKIRHRRLLMHLSYQARGQTQAWSDAAGTWMVFAADPWTLMHMLDNGTLHASWKYFRSPDQAAVLFLRSGEHT